MRVYAGAGINVVWNPHNSTKLNVHGRAPLYANPAYY
jgi:hypothetical protein